MAGVPSVAAKNLAPLSSPTVKNAGSVGDTAKSYIAPE